MLRRWRLARAAAPIPGPGAAVLLVFLFTTMGLITRLLCADGNGYSSFWPANAATLTALLTLRTSLSMRVLVACFGINLLLNQLSGLSAQESILACVMNVVLVLLVAFPTRRFCGACTDLSRLRRQMMFVPIVCAASAVEATIGIFVEARFMGDAEDIVGDWVQWLLCDSLGLVLATPAVLLLLDCFRRRRFPVGIAVEPLLLMLATILLAVLSFVSPRSFLFFFLYPAMVTLAFRARPAWVLCTVLLVSVIVSALTAHNMGPIALISPDGSMMRQNMLQPFLLSLFLSALPPSNALGEKRRYARRMMQMRAHLEHAATHDPLTGLVTRQLFKNRLSAHLQSGAGGTLLFIDLDHFKQINDTMGHQAGDTVLRVFSDRMRTCASLLGGQTARFGGDEFAMYVPRLASRRALRDAFRIVLEASRRPYHVAGQTTRMSVSIGAASLDPDIGHADEVIRRADEALYAAKDAGRDDYRLHGDPERAAAYDHAIGSAGGMGI